MTDYVFLHGGGQGSWVWDETIAALGLQTGGGFGRALALDVPGCGVKRSRDTSAIRTDDITVELIADIEAAGFEEVVLVGHSQAGNILPRMVQRRPDLFRRLVYLSCSSPLPGQTLMEMMGSGRRDENPEEVGWPLDPNTHSQAEQYPVMFCNDMGEAEAGAFLAKLGPDMWPMDTYGFRGWNYDGLDAVPATYVVCLQDAILPPAWQRRFAERYHCGRIASIDAGHQAMNTRPHALAEIVLHEAVA